MLLQIEENALMRQPLPTCHVTQSSLAWDRMGFSFVFVVSYSFDRVPYDPTGLRDISEADRARPHCLAMVHGKRRRRGHGRGTLKAIELSNRFETLFESEIRLDAKYDILRDSRAPPAREQNRLPLSIIHLGLATSQHAAQTTQRNPTSVESKVQPC